MQGALSAAHAEMQSTYPLHSGMLKHESSRALHSLTSVIAHCPQLPSPRHVGRWSQVACAPVDVSVIGGCEVDSPPVDVPVVYASVVSVPMIPVLSTSDVVCSLSE